MNLHVLSGWQQPVQLLGSHWHTPASQNWPEAHVGVHVTAPVDPPLVLPDDVVPPPVLPPVVAPPVLLPVGVPLPELPLPVLPVDVPLPVPLALPVDVPLPLVLAVPVLELLVVACPVLELPLVSPVVAPAVPLVAEAPEFPLLAPAVAGTWPWPKQCPLTHTWPLGQSESALQLSTPVPGSELTQPAAASDIAAVIHVRSLVTASSYQVKATAPPAAAAMIVVASPTSHHVCAWLCRLLASGPLVPAGTLPAKLS